MIKIFSKHIVALRNSPRINDIPFERVQEWLGQNPWSPFRKNHDSGKRREVIPDLSPAGPNETGGDGDRKSHDNVGSGYDKGLDPGGPADEELGPNNGLAPDKEQRYKSHDTSELAFKNDFDTSSKFSPLNYESNNYDRRHTNSTNNLVHVYEKPTMSRRTPVDRKSRRAASSWKHVYV